MTLQLSGRDGKSNNLSPSSIWHVLILQTLNSETICPELSLWVRLRSGYDGLSYNQIQIEI